MLKSLVRLVSAGFSFDRWAGAAYRLCLVLLVLVILTVTFPVQLMGVLMVIVLAQLLRNLWRRKQEGRARAAAQAGRARAVPRVYPGRRRGVRRLSFGKYTPGVPISLRGNGLTPCACSQLLDTLEETGGSAWML